MMVLNKNTKRETGRKAQLSNIQAAANVASVIRTTLGPKAMLKMMMDPMGGIVLTNDGNAILREIDVGHPAAKSLIELSRAQDEEVGDGTTSVIILAGEMLSVAESLLTKNLHPTTIVQGYMAALDESIKLLEDVAIPLNAKDEQELIGVVQSAIDTKFVSRWGGMISELAVKAALTVYEELPGGKKILDLKRYAKVEKIAGGDLDECAVLSGVMFNKDITHPKMRRKIKNPRVVLLDYPLEYKKGESQTNIEITNDQDWEAILREEEDEIQRVCNEILRVNPDVVITEKGISDLAQHFLLKKNVSCIRRLRKTDNNRVARVSGATIVNRPEELSENDVGTMCGLFEVKKIGDEYFTYMTECEDPKACTVLLRGASRDVLNEIERNLHDAWNVARNIILEPKLLPGGGATEMHLSMKLKERSREISGVKAYCYQAIASAFEVIPRSLAHNCGSAVVRLMTDLRAKHGSKLPSQMGLDGHSGKIVNAKEAGILDTFATKAQVIKAAIENAAMILRIDDIVSGQKKAKGPGGASKGPSMAEGNPNDALEGEGDQI